jgi:hypothetical protein
MVTARAPVSISDQFAIECRVTSSGCIASSYAAFGDSCGGEAGSTAGVCANAATGSSRTITMAGKSSFGKAMNPQSGLRIAKLKL